MKVPPENNFINSIILSCFHRQRVRGHNIRDKLFTNVKDTRSKPFVLMSVANIIPNRINVLIYVRSIFFSEKFAYTDIEISENKKQLGILNCAVQRLFITDCPEY